MFRLNHLFKQADAVQRYLAAPLTRSRLAYLAHRSLDSTAVYAKVALAGLRQVADFDLEGLA